jgi:uncharacterized protein (TIGR03435 family)
VKLNANCGTRRGFSDASSPGSLNLTCASLANLVQLAYVTFAGPKMNPVHLQVIGGPQWMDSEQFDIAATAPGDPPQGQMYGPMLQVLLEDRFHRASWEMPRAVHAGGDLVDQFRPQPRRAGCTLRSHGIAAGDLH